MKYPSLPGNENGFEVAIHGLLWVIYHGQLKIYLPLPCNSHYIYYMSFWLNITIKWKFDTLYLYNLHIINSHHKKKTHYLQKFNFLWFSFKLELKFLLLISRGFLIKKFTFKQKFKTFLCAYIQCNINLLTTKKEIEKHENQIKRRRKRYF